MIQRFFIRFAAYSETRRLIIAVCYNAVGVYMSDVSKLWLIYKVKLNMAIKPTVFKINMQIADMNRHYYNDHLLTIAQHPSETDERMMVRVLAFALNASDNLSFAEGITDQNQADLWNKDYNKQIKLWVSVGLPDEKLIRKAVSRAELVIIYVYGGRQAEMWWSKQKLMGYENLRVISFLSEDTTALANMASRGMKINFAIQEDEIMVSNNFDSINITQKILK